MGKTTGRSTSSVSRLRPAEWAILEPALQQARRVLAKRRDFFREQDEAAERAAQFVEEFKSTPRKSRRSQSKPTRRKSAKPYFAGYDPEMVWQKTPVFRRLMALLRKARLTLEADALRQTLRSSAPSATLVTEVETRKRPKEKQKPERKKPKEKPRWSDKYMVNATLRRLSPSEKAAIVAECEREERAALENALRIVDSLLAESASPFTGNDEGVGKGGGGPRQGGVRTRKPIAPPKKRGRPVDPATIRRADFAKPLHEQRKTWVEIATAYSKKHPRDVDASADTIRLAFQRQYPKPK